MTKKSKVILKEEEFLPVLEAELIDEESSLSTKPVKSQGDDKLPLAFTIGKIAGAVGAFLMGFFQNRRYNDLNKSNGVQCRGQRLRAKKRAHRRNR